MGGVGGNAGVVIRKEKGVLDPSPSGTKKKKKKEKKKRKRKKVVKRSKGEKLTIECQLE